MMRPGSPPRTDGVRELLGLTAVTVAAYVAGVLILAALFGALRLP